MKIDAGKFQVPEGETVHLRKWATRVKPVYHSKKDYQALLADHAARLCEQQKLLFASNSHALLIIFQAMDAAGKDGAIAHVMSGVDPQGCQVYSYKHPALRNCGMISSGAPPATCPSAARSASSTGLIMKKC